MTEYRLSLTLQDLCQQLQLSEQICIEMVEYGVVSPRGHQPADWAFDLDMVCLMQRALRLHHDLGLNWADVAVVSELIEERNRLLAENELLRQQLSRFMFD